MTNHEKTVIRTTSHLNCPFYRNDDQSLDQNVAKIPNLVYADSEDSDQVGRMQLHAQVACIDIR